MEHHHSKHLFSLLNLGAALVSLVIITLTLGFRVLPPIFILVLVPLVIGSLIWHLRTLSENWPANAKQR